jgi:hypothetical protein
MKLTAHLPWFTFASISFTSPAPIGVLIEGPTENAANTTLSRRDGIECGPGNGVWVLEEDFLSLVGTFCAIREYSDISDGYMVSDTYLVKLTPQGGQTVGDDGKIICKYRMFPLTCIIFFLAFEQKR